MADTEARPNIRIEIRNNLIEEMEVDEIEKTVESEGEEGEINEPPEAIEDLKTTTIFKPANRIWNNINGGFTTGINIFDKEEQEKLLERAKRFALKPDEIFLFTDTQLQALHDSLGVTEENGNNIRFEAIHMRGTQEMSTEDVLHYFYKFAPNGVEWIDDESCNVVWLDTISAARALFYVSRPVTGMPVRGPCNPFLKELDNEEEDTGKSILLKDKNREVQLEVDETVTVINKDDKEAVDVLEVSCAIPPGYWRLGDEHLKAKYILLRFAFKTDKKPFKAEKFSEYYKKHGNPNYGGLKGIISDTHKKKFKGIFDRNRDIQNTNKNPWGNLAENWDQDAQYRERSYQAPNIDVKTSTILNRLGFKRAYDPDSDSAKSEEIIKNPVKMPRMRMYADEEEAKIKRKKQLAAVKLENKLEPTDLRNVLGKTSIPVIKQEVENEVVVDLGTKLKNRLKNKNDVVVEKTKERKSLHVVSTSRSNHNKPDEYYDRKYESSYDDDYNNHKTKSKVAVVIKTQKKPVVASAISSRNISNNFKNRKNRKSESSNSSDESESSSSSDSTTGDSSSDNTSDEETESPKRTTKTLERPGFRSSTKLDFSNNVNNHKNPLRIEISNDHFRKE